MFFKDVQRHKNQGYLHNFSSLPCALYFAGMCLTDAVFHVSKGSSAQKHPMSGENHGRLRRCDRRTLSKKEKSTFTQVGASSGGVMLSASMIARPNIVPSAQAPTCKKKSHAVSSITAQHTRARLVTLKRATSPSVYKFDEKRARPLVAQNTKRFVFRGQAPPAGQPYRTPSR